MTVASRAPKKERGSTGIHRPRHMLGASVFIATLLCTPVASAQNQSGIGPSVPNTTLGFAPVAATSGEPSIKWINGEYQESHIDLSVKALGGSVDIARSWSQGRWWLNPAWAPLNFELDPLGRDAKIIERAGVIYERSGQSDLYIAKSKGSASVYIKALQSAAGQVQGWQWYDRLGNTIDYDREGRIQGYANPNGVRVSFAYDSASSARILDHHGATIYTATMAGGLITKVEDLTGRSVSYLWTGQRLTQVTDVLGAFWKYEYDGNGQITRRTDPLGAQTTAQYSQSIKAPEPLLSLGKAGVVIDPSGTSGTTQKLTNMWGGGRVGRLDSKGCTTSAATQYLREQRVFQVTHIDCRGNTTVTVSDLQGNELNKTFNGRRTATNQWDGAYVQKSTDARGHTTITNYDTNYQPLQITHPDGGVEKNTYEPIYGHKTSHTNQLGVVTTWAYDSKGRVVESVQAKGQPEQRTTRYQYDQWGQLTSTTRGAGDGRQADAITQTYTYDTAGNVTKTTNGQGHTTSVSYDRRGAPTSLTDALNRTTTFTIDAVGRLIQSTDPLGHSTQVRYDARGRRTHVISPTGKTQVTRYDSEGRVLQTIAPGQSEGAGTRIEYDAAGQPIKTISPSGLVMQTSYDTQGRISKTTDPAGNVTSYEYGQDGTPQADLLIAIQYPTYKETYQYDSRGRRTTVTQHLENGQTRTQSQTYDALGQPIGAGDAALRTSISKFDALGRLVHHTDPIGNITNQTWDAHDQLRTLKDVKGDEHQFTYDKAGQLIKETRPLGGETLDRYDGAGQLVQRTDAGGNVRAYEYDLAGRLIREEHKMANTGVDQSITYQYDAAGQLTAYEQKDGSGLLISSALYTQDARGRISKSAITYGRAEERAENSSSLTFTVGQEFNADGQLKSHTYPDGSESGYTYEKGLLDKVILPDMSSIAYGGYRWQIPTMIRGAGFTKRLTLDALQRPLAIEVTNISSQIIASRRYQYDNAGDISQITSEIGQTLYGYDQLSRLIKVVPDQHLQALGLPIEGYSYDPSGNRTFSLHQSGSWSYNKNNQLTQYPKLVPFEHSAVPLSTHVTYNQQGHVAKEINNGGARIYEYNAAERRIRYVTTPSNVTDVAVDAHYRYDPFGRRISKVVKKRYADSEQSRTTYYIYSNTGLMAEMDGSGKLERAYGYDPKKAQQGQWMSDPIWQADIKSGQQAMLNSGADLHYLQTDHLGAPMVAIDQSGNVSWKGVSESFGAIGVLRQESQIEMNLRLPGQYFDEESGEHYNFHRVYRPTVGRYAEEDPISLAGGANIYAYVSNNPMNFVDPFGLRGDNCLPDQVFGPLEIISSTFDKNFKVGTRHRPGLIFDDPGPKDNIDPRSPRNFPIKPGFDKYFVVDVFDVWNQNTYNLTETFQSFARICKYTVVDDCGNESVETRTTFFRKKLTSTEVLVNSREYEIRVNRYKILIPF